MTIIDAPHDDNHDGDFHHNDDDDDDDFHHYDDDDEDDFHHDDHDNDDDDRKQVTSLLLDMNDDINNQLLRYERLILNGHCLTIGQVSMVVELITKKPE